MFIHIFQVTQDIGPTDVPSDSEQSIVMPNLCSFTFLLVYSFSTNNGTLKHVIQVVLLFFQYFTIFQ